MTIPGEKFEQFPLRTARATAGDFLVGYTAGGDNGQWPAGLVGRDMLTADRTYYVRTDGSDSNNGLTNSASGAFKTLQYAWDTLSASLDIGNHNLIVRLIGAGPYVCTDAINGFVGVLGNKGRMVLQGDGVTTEVQDAFWTGSMGCEGIVVRDVKLTGPVQTIGIQSYMTGRIDLVGDIAFANCPSASMFASNNGTLLVSGGAQISVTGNSVAFGWANDMGQLYFEGNTTGIGPSQNGVVTMVGAPVFSSTMLAGGQAQINCNQSSTSFVGSATGIRYSADGLSLITTGGGGPNLIPGDQAGVTTNGGVYI